VYRKRALLCGSLLLCAAALARAGTFPPATALIPADGTGLTRQGAPAVYAGDRLFDYIDGGAPQFMEYGFAETVSQELSLNGRTYILDVYRMDDPLAALGVFSVRRPVKCTPIGPRFLSCFLAPQAMLAYGPYYIEIAAYETVPETATEMTEIAVRATAAVDSAPAPADLLAGAPFTALPATDRVAGTEKLARGPISLRTALGRFATGPLNAMVEAAQAALEKRAEPSWDSTRARANPIWVTAEYHLNPSGERPTGATQLVALVGPHDPDSLARVARAALPAGTTTAQPAPWAWITVGETAGHTLFGVVRGTDLLLGSSSLPADALEVWVTQLGAPGGRP
jgi:hypothetical protein